MKDTFSCRYTEYRAAVADADTLSVHSERFIEISRAEKRLSQLFSAWEQLLFGKVCIEIWSNSYGLHLLPLIPPCTCLLCLLSWPIVATLCWWMIVAFVIVVVAVVVLGERQNRFSKMETISVVSMRFFFSLFQSLAAFHQTHRTCCAVFGSLSLSLYIKEVLQ